MFHLSRVTIVDGRLTISFKQKWDEELPTSFADVTADIRKAVAFIMEIDWNRSITQYKWKNHIEFEVRGSLGGFSKPVIDAKGPPVGAIKKMIVSAIYKWMRPKPVQLAQYLASPCCRATLVTVLEAGEVLQCSDCQRKFGRTHGYWDLRIPR